MNKFLLALSACFILSCNNSKTAEDKTENDQTTGNTANKEFFGNVKEINETWYNMYEEEGGAENKEMDFRKYTLYDKKGKILVTIIYGGEGDLGNAEKSNGQKTVYTYNADGKPLSDTVYGVDGKIAEYFNRTYDQKGNEIEKTKFEPDGSRGWYEVYKYNAEGKKTEELLYGKDDTTALRKTFAYDGKGNMTSSIVYEEDGSILQKDEFAYDDKGNNTEVKSYRSDGSLFSHYVSRYNEQNRKIEQLTYKPGTTGIERRETLRYDEKGNETEMIDVFSGEDTLTMETRYDKPFDKQGNWTRKSIYMDRSKTPEQIAERTIVYY